MASTRYLDALDGFDCQQMTFDGKTRDVWCAGEGRGVVVMHEIPGLHPDVVRFARLLVAEGFTVWMPDMFGELGRPFSDGYARSSIVRACISREFNVMRWGRTSPITVWLRALARRLSEQTGGKVGAVGMCLTGGFALAMMVDECIGAPVLSQPSLPFGFFSFQHRDLGIDADDLVVVKARCAAGTPVLGLRYDGDPMVPAARFERLREELGERFEAIELPSNGDPELHSVLSRHWHEPTVRRVVEFFDAHTG